MNLPTLFALWTVQGLAAFIWLMLLPSDSGSFSLSRLALLGFALTLSGLSAWLWFRSRKWTQTPLIPSTVIHNSLYLLALLAALGAPLTILILQSLGQTTYTYAAYASRLAPLAFWFTFSGLEWCLWQIRPQKPDFSDAKPFLLSTLYILLAMALVAIFITTTKLGLTPSRDGSFGAPATPLLEWQLALALSLGLAAAFVKTRWRPKQPDTFYFLLIYLLTCLLWLSDPLIPGFFATPPRAPNFEPYPFSDALIYAQYAQSALVGEGLLWPDIPTRPLYVSLLVWLHALAGQNYYQVITLQTLLLAFFPACLYLWGKELGSRPLGVILALLAALRDLTANHAAPFALNYTYSKLFFSEIPAALVLTIFTILALRWLKAPKPAWYLLLMGGVLGTAALIRLQSAVLLAPLAVVSLLLLWKMRRIEWLRGLVLMTLGVMLTLSPWLIRNYLAAGGLVVDNPISQSMVLARRWGGSSGNEGIQQLPGESTAQYVSRLNGLALDHLKREPERILTGATNHFFNNLIASLYVFPDRGELNSLGELLWPTRAFWQTGGHSLPVTMLNLLLFALGLAAAWRQLGWAGLLPLALSLGYHAWTALFLSSGDRFLVPIDWSTSLYHAWGLFTLGKLALTGLRGIAAGESPALFNGDTAARGAKIPAWGQVTLTAAAILLIGASIPLSESVFPKKYPGNASCPIALQTAEICAYGRAIYPRYYAAGEGEPGTAKQGYGASAEARLVFFLVGPRPGLVIVPLEDAPGFFPHTAEVWIAGANEGDVLRARSVIIELNGKSATYTP